MRFFNFGKSAPPESLAEANTTFAFDLYARLKDRPGNLFFSPYGISACLAMACAGARGNTEKQMLEVLKFKKDPSWIRDSFAKLQVQLDAVNRPQAVKLHAPANPRHRTTGEFTIPSGVELITANALWAQHGYPFLSEFLETVRNAYQAHVNQADFKANAHAVAGEINHWVAEKTKNRINGIIAPGSLDELTRLVLVNAIYFKGDWASPFKRHQTSIQPFHLSRANHMEMPFMHQVTDVNYAENKEFQMIELPYKGNSLSMVVLLPRRLDGSHRLEQRLDAAFISRSLAQMKNQVVEIFLPRFKLEMFFNLNDSLAQMGMSDAFVFNTADFSGINGNRELYISSVVHKAWVEVNEEGTEAAAATAIAMIAGLCMDDPPPPPVFRADHPFIFMIRDIVSGSLLFLGRLENPDSALPG